MKQREWEKEARRHFRAAKRGANEARKAKVCVTCAASRHVQMMAEYIGARKQYHMITEEPEHCAESMLSVVASLYKARARIAELERKLAK
jgi:ubiquinone biosynthesis protein UbiJ